MFPTCFLCDIVNLLRYYKKGDDSMTYSTGEKPGKGTYQCTNCGQEVVLDDNTDTLPPCPKCAETKYIKIS